MNNLKKEVENYPIKSKSIILSTPGFILTGIKEFFTKPSKTQILSLLPFICLTAIMIITKDATSSLGNDSGNPEWIDNLLSNIIIFTSIPFYFWCLGCYTTKNNHDIETLNIENMNISDIYEAEKNGRIKIIKRNEFI